MDCNIVQHEPPLEIFPLEENRTCPDSNLMYLCKNNRCIYRRWMCDGEDDCRNGEDEIKENCSSESRETFLNEECSLFVFQTVMHSHSHCRFPEKDCADSMFRCPHTQRCIPQSWICDHDDDCGDGTDEHANCSTYSPFCGNLSFLSKSGYLSADMVLLRALQLTASVSITSFAATTSAASRVNTCVTETTIVGTAVMR